MMVMSVCDYNRKAAFVAASLYGEACESGQVVARSGTNFRKVEFLPLGGPSFNSAIRVAVDLGLQSLCENLKLAQFCSARLSSGHWGRGDTKNARLKGGRYKTMPILSSDTDSSAPEVSGFKTPDGATFFVGTALPLSG